MNQQGDFVITFNPCQSYRLFTNSFGHFLHDPNVQRLFGWHAALFPTGYSGMHKIRVAPWWFLQRLSKAILNSDKNERLGYIQKQVGHTNTLLLANL